MKIRMIGAVDKRDIRASVRTRLRMLTSDEKNRQSKKLCKRALSHRLFSESRVIALFVSLKDEPETRDLIAQLSEKHRVVLPRVEGDIMQFYNYTPSSMRIGSFGIEEPCDGTPISPRDIDVIFVPGVAFTQEGARLGRGKGYYDKYMSQDGFRAYRIGYCFKEQIVENIPCEKHDVKVQEML